MSKFKATVISPANIAFIKYWGWNSERDKKLILPANDSISMNLDSCVTKTTVEFSPLFKKDSVEISFFGEKSEEFFGETFKKVICQVNRLRSMKNINYPVKVVSNNSFPANAGIASSASAFSALTLAASQALGYKLDTKKLSIETRLSGSGSACRSIVDGFACWQKGVNSESSYAYQIKDEKWWDLVDIVAVVNVGSKKISSRDGHELAITSPYYSARLKELPDKVKNLKEAIFNKDFNLLGETIEQEAISMHTVCMTCRPSIFYWDCGTLEIIHAIQSWRQEGLFSYFTMDAGSNVHVICREQDAQELNKKLMKLKRVLFTIINRPCKGARLIDDHLF